MPKAIKGSLFSPIFPNIHPLTSKEGVLVECDPSIKAIILKIDQEKHDYIVEDLDDQTLVIKETQLQRLKARLAEELANTQQMPEDEDTE
ncbi:TFIIH complex subunit tfb5 [Lecanora helva]